MELSPTLRSRFEAGVDWTPTASGCLEWQGCLTNGGYGMISIATGVSRLTHRVAWFLEHGRWPGPAILHSCDNRKCVNTAHMSEGTKGDNNQDTARKRRYHYGTNHHNGKLTERQVSEIRARRAAGETGADLAREFDVSQSLVSQICKGKVRQ